GPVADSPHQFPRLESRVKEKSPPNQKDPMEDPDEISGPPADQGVPEEFLKGARAKAVGEPQPQAVSDPVDPVFGVNKPPKIPPIKRCRVGRFGRHIVKPRDEGNGPEERAQKPRPPLGGAVMEQGPKENPSRQVEPRHVDLADTSPQ